MEVVLGCDLWEREFLGKHYAVSASLNPFVDGI